MEGDGMFTGPERPRIAVLVLHGVGQQAKFETLSAFAAGLAGVAGATKAERRPVLLGDKVDSMLSLDLPEPGAVVDLIEYHYQPLLQRHVTLADAARWLVEVGFHIRRLYAAHDFGADEEAKGLPPPDFEFQNLHYMLRQPDPERLVRVVNWVARRLDGMERARGRRLPSVAGVMYGLLARFLDDVLLEVAGDLITYTAYDPRLALSGVRDAVLGGCVDRIEQIVRCDDDGRPRWDKVFVAGHSLGSVVAYDALSRIALRADHAPKGETTTPPLSEGQTERIGGLVTFGSPLDKVAMMFWPREEGAPGRPDETAAERAYRLDRIELRKALLAHFHGVRGVSDALGLPEGIGQPEEKTFKDLPWFNVHHRDDLVAGHLDAFQGVENKEITVPLHEARDELKTLEAHLSYWSDETVYRWLLGRFAVAVAESSLPHIA